MRLSGLESGRDPARKRWGGFRSFQGALNLVLRPFLLFCVIFMGNGLFEPSLMVVGAIAHGCCVSFVVRSFIRTVVAGICPTDLENSDRRRNTPKSGHNRSESLCAGLWAPCRVFWAWFGPALGPNPARNRRFPAGSLKVFGALLAQPIGTLFHTLGLGRGSRPLDPRIASDRVSFAPVSALLKPD